MVADFLSPDLAGFEFEPQTSSWRPRDTMLYALGVGARPATELEFLYEGKGPLVLPTYAVIPAMMAMANLRQAVKLKLSRLLHGEQSIELLRPLPANCDITLRSHISEIWDKGKSAVIGVSAVAEDADGPLFKSHSSLYYIGGGGFGGEPGPSSRDKNQPPSRAPDRVVEYQTREEQGALYRLCGDRVPLHIDPEFARQAGYEKPFMHGLCTYGFVGRALLSVLCDNRPENFTSMTGRFSERVEFGDKIITRIWKTTPGEAVVQAETQDGKVVLSQAAVSYKEQRA
jgi:acyl dehydratase